MGVVIEICVKVKTPREKIELSPLKSCANNTVPGKAEGGQNDRCLKALTGPSGRAPPAR